MSNVVNGVQKDKSAQKAVSPARQALLDFNGDNDLGVKITYNGKTIDQKSEPIKPLVGVTADQMKTVVDHLRAALKGANSKYSLKGVIAELQGKGISLEKLMSKINEILADGLFSVKNLSDDEVIKAALQAIGLSADQIAGLEIKVEAKPEDLSDLATEEEPAANPEAKPAKNNGEKPAASPAPATASASAKTDEAIPQGLDQNGYEAWKLVKQISGNGSAEQLQRFVKAWSDDKRINLDEARALGIAGKDDQLFKAADNRMRVNQSSYSGKGENDHYLDLDELKEVVKVATEYSRMSGGVNIDGALTMYRSMYLMDVDFEGIRHKLETYCKDGDAGFKGLDLAKLTDRSYLETQFKALKSSIAGELFNLIMARVEKKTITDGKALGLYMFSCAMASMTGNYNGFGVSELKDSKIGKYLPRRAETSAEDFAEWVKEGKVKEERETAGASDHADEQKIGTVQNKLNGAKNYSELNKVVDDNRKTIEDNSILTQIAANKYYDFRNEDNGKGYDKFIEMATHLTKDEKTKYLEPLLKEGNGALTQSDGKAVLAAGTKTIQRLEQLLKTMLPEEASVYYNYLYQFEYELAEALVKKDMSKEALELVEKYLPANAQMTLQSDNPETANRGVRQITISGLEAKFRIAFEAGDAKAIAAPESASALDKTLAKVYQAKLELQNALKKADYKEAEKVMGRYAEALKSLSGKKSESEISDRLFDDIKQLLKGTVGAQQKLSGKLVKLMTAVSKHKGKTDKPEKSKDEKADKNGKPAKATKDHKATKPTDTATAAGDKKGLDAVKGKINSYIEGVVKGADSKTDAGVTIAWSGPKLQIEDEDLKAQARKYAQSYLEKKHKDYELTSVEGNDVIKQKKK